MATAQQLIERALRMTGVKGAGETPSPDEAADALTVLQDLYYDLIDKGADLTDVRIAAAYTAGEDERIFNTTGAPLTITLPEEVEDTSLIPDSSGDQLRPPKDFAIVSVAGSPRQTHLYDATLGAWVEIEDLALGDIAPWSTQLGRGLTCMLAVDLASEYGVQPTQIVLLSALEARQRVNGRFQTGSVFFQPDRRWC